MRLLEIKKVIDKFNKQDFGGLEIYGKDSFHDFQTWTDAFKVKVLKVKGLDLKARLEQVDNNSLDIVIYVNGYSILRVEEVKEVYIW